jgi:hypothetical protein
LINQLKEQGGGTAYFDIARLQFLDKYKYERKLQLQVEHFGSSVAGVQAA